MTQMALLAGMLEEMQPWIEAHGLRLKKYAWQSVFPLIDVQTGAVGDAAVTYFEHPGSAYLFPVEFRRGELDQWGSPEAMRAGIQHKLERLIV